MQPSMYLPNQVSPKGSKDAAPFLKNLRKMLEVESEAILRWTPNGKAFEIHDMEQMAQYVLPKYFKHCKYTSFQRQLNYFNFRKWTKSKAVVCTFSNEFFLRDHPELAWRITRKKSLSSPLHQHNHKTMVIPASPPSPSSPLNTIQPQQPHYWKNMLLSAPESHQFHHRLPFPPPTCADMIQSRIQQQQSMRRFARHHHPGFADMLTDKPESLDWIDCLLPPVDHRVEDEIYSYMYPSSMVTSTINTTAMTTGTKCYDFVM